MEVEVCNQLAIKCRRSMDYAAETVPLDPDWKHREWVY